MSQLLVRGSVGPAVTTLQQNLNTVGVSCDVDGTYGGGTEKAVKTFQTANGVEPDGKYGATTHGKMDECLAMLSGGANA